MKVRVKLEDILKHKIYDFVYDFGKDYSEEGAFFMFEEGNYSCDCNRSIIIKECCDLYFPDLKCGQRLKLLSIETV